MPENKKIPENYQSVMPYLIIKDATAFLSFMQKVFSAKEINKTMRDEKTIMHGEIMIGESTIMFADSTDNHNVQTAGLFVYVDNADTAYNAALDNGATKITELSNQDYGRSGGIKDPFGNTWWITSLK